MKQWCRTKPKERQAVLEKLKPEENEFFAMTSLLFWATSKTITSWIAASQNYNAYRWNECERWRNGCKWKLSETSVQRTSSLLSVTWILITFKWFHFAEKCCISIITRYESEIYSLLFPSLRCDMHNKSHGYRPNNFQNNNKIKETFEIFRLLDIFSDDSFTYTLNKSWTMYILHR